MNILSHQGSQFCLPCQWIVQSLAPENKAEPQSSQIDQAIALLLAGNFRWSISQPLVAPADRPDDPCRSIKDPSIVFYQERWHLFCTIRSQKRTHQIEYLSFIDWKDANSAERHILKMHSGYFCAPQVFYFAPLKAWFIIKVTIFLVTNGTNRNKLHEYK